MSILSRLFGGGGGAKDGAAEPASFEEYEGYRIYAEPASTSGGFRVSARIERDVEGETRAHQMIRADVISSMDEARATTVLKARQLIDQQGDAIFR
ncbi:HlyU family transcriptional regulator [Pseudaestuariivita atlantica]|uniref:Transcriptional activator HlyU n=1 Tax=Pseudaestuariivita atlantica TaxID=1317121 RepID=A0A0L1JLT8_9RHOB|nr:HlyU family transcriptional regulator [Pseudaestuariivita atlantica]KNG92719.1 hypothetical protein ATO11_16645 [Pseudaestuariivita atlantica]